MSSQRRDLIDKPPIYAQAGVPTYWVVDLDRHRGVMHTTLVEGRYARVDTVDPGGDLVAAELGLTISLGELLAAAAR